MKVPAAPMSSTRRAMSRAIIGKFVVDGDKYKQVAMFQ